MKISLLLRTLTGLAAVISLTTQSEAQNIFPVTGRTGIYTTSPATSLQVRGSARFGSNTNYTNIDSATGNLSFGGNAAYRVAGNRYAFQYAGDPDYGLFFNQTNVRYEFRDGNASPVFLIDANTGAGVFNNTLKVGAYTLPATDGLANQVLKTNGSGVLTWSNDNSGSSLTAGPGISIAGNVISNTAPDQVVSIAGTNGVSVSGTYPSFTVSGSNFWRTSGNSGSSLFLGTTDANDLVFRTNNTEAMRLTTTRRLGLGTNAPVTNLHVVKGSAGGGGLSSAVAVLENNSTNHLQLLTPNNTEKGIVFGEVGNGLDGGIFYMSTSKQIQFRSKGNVTRMFVDTTSKLTVNGKLDVNGTSIDLGTIESFADSGSNVIATNSDLINQSDGIFNGLGVSNQRWVDVWAVDGTINTSDAREKNSIRNLDYGLKEIMQLKSVRFKWNKGPDRNDRLGVIAQEVQKVIPEVVWDHEYVRDEATGAEKKVPAAVLGIQYDGFIPILIRGIQQQQAIIDEQNKKIEAQNQKIEALTRLVEKVLQNQSVTTTGTGDALLSGNNGTASIKLVPNPATSTLTINGLQKTGVINIIDMQGIQLIRRQVTGSNENLNISNLRAGTYVVQYILNGQVQTQKLVKE